MEYFLAIDIGASSGRHIIGYLEDNQIKLEEIYRFPNGVKDSSFGLVWDLDALFIEVKKGIKIAIEKYKNIKSLSIDTWGVDYVLLDKDDKVIPPYYSYRNNRVDKIIDEVHNKISFKELYERTGIQFAKFNTIYQLYDDKKNNRLDNATSLLMIPTYLSYLLTGIKVNEATNVSTTGLVNINTKEIDKEILSKLGIKDLFINIKEPTYKIGYLKDDIAKEVGGNILVKLAPSHDTASAFEALDVSDDSIILSSGTWSLIGTKIDKANNNEYSFKSNFTNEGGINYFRYLKNIMGMWIINNLRKELNISFEDISKGVRTATYNETFDVNDSSLLSPKSMKEALLNLLKDNPPKDDYELFKSIYDSLALSYKNAIEEIEHNLNKKYHKLYIIGGGAKATYLNEVTKKITNMEVIALPIEATALGNIKTQKKKKKR